MSPYLALVRPFTLLAPGVGMVCAGIYGLGVCGIPWDAAVFRRLGLAALAAMALNAASNVVNQIFDCCIDRINKPDRPLCTGAVSLAHAWLWAAGFLMIALGCAALVNPVFWGIVAVTALITYAYSGPPLRTKRWGLLANLTIAVPRGGLLVVAGWASVAPVARPDPWWVGLVFFLFILGAATTKDYSDMAGDRAGGCITLPLRYGVSAAAWMTAPFFVLPFLLLAILAQFGFLGGSPTVLTGLGLGLAVWGAYTAGLFLRNPQALATERNHPSWKHMYLMLMVGQGGVALAGIL